MQIHTTMIGTADTAQKGHTILRSPVACSHDIAPTTGRWCTIHSRDAPRCIFSAVESNVEPYDRSAATWGRPLYDDDLGYLAILAKVFMRTQGRNELYECQISFVKRQGSKLTSSLANLWPIPTTYTTLRCTTRTLAK